MNALDFFHLEGTSRIPTIFNHTDAQLENAITTAAKKHPDFFVLLHGIDAYMERRRRRIRLAKKRRIARQDAEWKEVEALDRMWGNS